MGVMSQEVTEMTDVETLYALQRRVEQADDAWFEALARGDSGAAEKQTHKAALAEFRQYEAVCLDAGLRVECGRCGGDGVVHYGNVTFTTAHGPERTCFECGGARTVPVRKHKFVAQAPTRFRKSQAARAKQAEKVKAEQERWDAFAAEHADVAAFLTEHGVRPDDDYGTNDFLCSMRESVLRWGSLTEKQMAAVERNMEKMAWEAAAVAFPSGTVEVEGEIVSLPATRGYTGGSKMNMLVALSGDFTGNKVMGTIPEKVWDAMRDDENERSASLIGSRVRFTAAFSKSDRDDHFGFFKSPKGVEVTHVNWNER